MALTAYQVNQIYDPWVSHGYEPIAHFTDRAVAERYAAQCNAQAIAEGWKYYETVYTHEVEEITVDDPDVLARMAGG